MDGLFYGIMFGFPAVVVLGFIVWYLIDIKRGRAEWNFWETIWFAIIAYFVISFIIWAVYGAFMIWWLIFQA